jgi:hypothetical protein
VYNFQADALAIAPYFGHSLNAEVYSLLATATIEQVLDMARRKVVLDTYESTKASAAVASSFGVALIAYEGGQHMGGTGTTCGNDDCSNVAQLQQLFMDANRHPRIAGLYDNMLRWALGRGFKGQFVSQSVFIELPGLRIHDCLNAQVSC